jgi:hypothetical protein
MRNATNLLEHSRHLLLYGKQSITDKFDASSLWKKGYHGEKVLISVKS